MRMKNIVFFLLCCFYASTVVGQQDTTIIYVRPGIERDPVRANLKKVVTKNDSLWQVSLYAKKNVLFEQVSFADEKLEVRKGSYLRYDNGILIEKSQYNRGYKVGSWIAYHLNGNPKRVSHYVWDKLNGSYLEYWDNNQLKEKTTYVNGSYRGERNIFYKDGTPALKELYDEKGLVSGAYFDKKGAKVNRTVVVGLLE